MPKILFNNDMYLMQEEKILIQIDTVPQSFSYDKDVKILNKFDVFTKIFTTPIDILLSQKIYAALNRKRSKGRDFFDIVFLIPQTKPNFKYLKEKLNISNGKDLKKELLKRTESINFDNLAEDVKPFLINFEDFKKVKMFREYIDSVEF